MVRTQVQLSEDQLFRLKSLAARRGTSLAELVREGVDHVLTTADAQADDERRRRALAVAGRFRSGVSDLATEHDRYLAEAQDS